MWAFQTGFHVGKGRLERALPFFFSSYILAKGPRTRPLKAVGRKMPKCLARGTCFSALRGRHRRRRRDLRRASPLRGTQSLFPWHSDACSTMASRRRARGARCATSSWLVPWLACATALVALQPIYRFNFIKLAGSYSLGTPYHPSPTCHLNCFTEFSWVTFTLFSFCYGEMYNGAYLFWKLNLKPYACENVDG